MMTRRDLLRGLGLIGGAAATTAALPTVAAGAVGAAIAQRREPPPELPPVEPGTLMLASTWNDLVDRVNELSRSDASRPR